ncbi:MAG TPA: ATP-binding protein [Candidatus Saccharimonadia bacterium]|nr:ATP-binding protein [Candidatus Saccharimonadia bacterium]
MGKRTLYLFIGAPGAGKTTAAKLIAERSGAVHLWADAERHKLFPEPTHSEDESLQLYDQLNDQAASLLRAGQSVVFDTNFNFYADRQKLRQIADEAGADTLVIWMTTPREVAHERSVHTPVMRNGYMYGMTDEQFDAITSKLEEPHEDEKVIKIDGTKLDGERISSLLGL